MTGASVMTAIIRFRNNGITITYSQAKQMGCLNSPHGVEIKEKVK